MLRIYVNQLNKCSALSPVARLNWFLECFLKFPLIESHVLEGRVYNPDVTRNALDFIKRKVSEENWTEMTW